MILVFCGVSRENWKKEAIDGGEFWVATLYSNISVCCFAMSSTFSRLSSAKIRLLCANLGWLSIQRTTFF